MSVPVPRDVDLNRSGRDALHLYGLYGTIMFNAKNTQLRTA